MPHKGKTDRDTKTKKPNFFTAKTKNLIKEIARITKLKIPTSPPLNGIDSRPLNSDVGAIWKQLKFDDAINYREHQLNFQKDAHWI